MTKRKNFDLLKFDYDDVVACDWACEYGFEPFAVSTELRPVPKTLISTQPNVNPNQLMPVSVVWFKREVIEGDDITLALAKLKEAQDAAREAAKTK